MPPRILETMTEVGVVGANGYSGEELCRILASHPSARLAIVTSRQHDGRKLGDVLPRLDGYPAARALVFKHATASELLDTGLKWFFLALPHGLACEFAGPLVEGGARVIDLSADFRLRDAAVYEEFYGAPHPAMELLARAVYGLPELHRERIAPAGIVASAGCYPTSILLPLAPLLRADLLDPESISVSSASGVSGAGRKAETAYLFGECNESLHAYGVPKHRHISEIEQELSMAAGRSVTITFVPHLAPMTRGIHTTIFARPRSGAGENDLKACLAETYREEPFVRFRDRLPDTKHVTGSNFCDITMAWDRRTGRVILLSALDNLVKGAAGQAVQNFNIMAGQAETEGLL